MAFHLVGRLTVPRSDSLIIPLSSFLIGMGLIMLYRLKPSLLLPQLTWIAIAVFLSSFLLVVLKNYWELEGYKYTFALLGFILLLSPALFGHEISGAKLWLKFGNFSFQPAEIAKILIVIFLAAYLKEKGELLSSPKEFLGFPFPSLKYLGPLLVTWGISLLILVFEKDLGTSFLFFGIFLSLLYASTGRVAYIGTGGFLFLTGVFTCYRIYPHVENRVAIWLNPWNDIDGRGYQIVQSLFAIASGKLAGSGLNLGFPNYIPAAHTDFVFSGIAEELGLLGGTAILLAYIILISRVFKVALKTRDSFGKLLALGLGIVFALQTIIIVGGVTRLLPLTGITLPLISYGGSSMVSS
ncbi:MAG: FtsW/RodA/SpoVE family cell cycle protein, partial [Candidatus Subteraquimicrobiales bacterium]|nr:FtsW/RodA/SpoVE family cell cycle protein [Candidatus Subteraquimicrobiales bacterium]